MKISATMTNLTISLKRLDLDMAIPKYAYPGDGALDLASAIDITIMPGERACVPTGIAISLPANHAALVLPRSGLAKNKGITILNSPGLIDSNYRGEICVILYNSDNDNNFVIKKHDRIAQLLITPVPHITFEEVTELDETKRNGSGFGSSGLSA